MLCFDQKFRISKLQTVFVTGASGFIGTAVLNRLSADPCTQVLAHVRREVSLPENVRPVVSASSGSLPDPEVLQGVTSVVHCAARVHVMNELCEDSLHEFRAINVQDTLSLARAAAKAGVKRFIFLSSIKVNGESTKPGRPFTAADEPAPTDAYGISKMEAEQGLQSISRATGMELTIIRPVLVYGPGVKANFRKLMGWLGKGVPLPLGCVGNRRSLVAVDNLVDLVMRCLEHPAAANQTFLVSDGEDLSTTELLRRMGRAMGRPARLIPVPVPVICFGAASLGRRDLAQRLCASLQVDISKTCDLLGWRPPVTVDQALEAAVKDYRGGRDAKCS